MVKIVFQLLSIWLILGLIVFAKQVDKRILGSFLQRKGGVTMSQNSYNFIQSFEQMMLEIESEIAITAHITGVHKLSDKAISAFKNTPRHLFVELGEEVYAYDNRPLPIGEGQTISQPFIVALMTELLDVQPNDKVLEIGTGSGYQAAILSKLAAEVYTVEYFPSLAKEAERRVKEHHCFNVHVRAGDGYTGWKEHAPYNKIIVTASADQVPQALIDQLSPNGIMVIPIGRQDHIQYLTVVKKDANGRITQKHVLEVAFVPFL